MALFVALALLLGAVPSPPPTHGFFKLVALPLILSGLILGPKAGFWVGALSDILGYFLYPSGPYFPLFTLTQALTGALPAWFLGGSGNGAPSWRRLCAVQTIFRGACILPAIPAASVMVGSSGFLLTELIARGRYRRIIGLFLRLYTTTRY